MGSPRRVNSAQQAKLDILAQITIEERNFRLKETQEFEARLAIAERDFAVRKSQIIHELRASGSGVSAVPHATIQAAANAVNWNKYKELLAAFTPVAVEPVQAEPFEILPNDRLQINWWLGESGSRVERVMTGDLFFQGDFVDVRMDEPEWDAEVRSPWFSANVAPQIISRAREARGT